MATQLHPPKTDERHENGNAQLYVVSTPIGNLEDLTYRASRILKEVEVVACEDTRRTRRLLSAIGSSARAISCHMHKEQRCASAVIGYLKQGVDVAFASDAGVPAISDPGARLVARVREAGFGVVPVPGPSSLTAALSVAGIPADTFYFGGFIPARGKERKEALQQLAMLECTLVILESPHRILKTLEDLLHTLGNRIVFLAREMTKLHETYWYGPMSELLERLSSHTVRGEFTLVIEGSSKGKAIKLPSGKEPAEIVAAMIHKGISVKDAAYLAAEITGMNKKEAYDIALRVSKGMRRTRNGP